MILRFEAADFHSEGLLHELQAFARSLAEILGFVVRGRDIIEVIKLLVYVYVRTNDRTHTQSQSGMTA